jgi:ATP/maltotriose-dependent transcriptional regulator MalT
LTAALVNEIAAVPGGLDLVLDDYHLIDSEAVHGILSFMLERLPEDAHLVILSRTDPPLPLAKLRARGQMVELGAAELAFTEEEAGVFLKSVMGLGLSAEDVASLEGRTEGWIAGLQLAALSMRDWEDASDFVEIFSGSHRDVLDFLADEVLESQPEATREFLLSTSVLGSMSAPLCDALAGRGGELVEVLALQAVALWEGSEREWAVGALTRALALAAPEGYVRTFVDEGPPMAEILVGMLEAQKRGNLQPPVPARYLGKLLAALERDSARVESQVARLPERLSGREHEILRLVAAGESNRRIASDLFVTVGTVKTHLNNAYRKLGVRSRTQAVARARDLELI